MTSFIAALLPNQGRAIMAAATLESLHLRGRITLFGVARVACGADGTLSVLARPDTPGGAAVADLVDVLVVAGGIRAGAAAPLNGTRSIGCLGGLAGIGGSMDFLEACLQRLTHGTVAVLAEADEHWLAPLDVALSDLEATLLRAPRHGHADAQLAWQIATLERELRALEREAEEAETIEYGALRGRAHDTRARLSAAATMADRLLQRIEAEAQARQGALRVQLDHAQAEPSAGRGVEARILQSLERARRQSARRAAVLEAAVSRARAALGSEEAGRRGRTS